MKKLFFLLSALMLISFDSTAQKTAQKMDAEKKAIATTLDSWHKAAADVDFTKYFNMMSDESIFIGTDPTENWNKKQFQEFAQYYIDKGSAWHFKAIQRNIYVDPSGKIAWFDELLDTEMKLCQGSGVMVKEGKEWKIKHYVLSMTVPNDSIKEVIKIKSAFDDALITKLKK